MAHEEDKTTLAHLSPSKSDPSALTTQMVLREVEILDDRISKSDASIYAKIEDAVVSRQREQLALKELVESKLTDMALIREEKLNSIETQFELSERQRIEQKKDTKDAVDAALIAQKEAVREQTIASGLSIAKSEAATEKRLEQLNITMNTAFTSSQQSTLEMKDNFSTSISDLKDRIGRIESVKVGATEQKAAVKDNISMIQMIGGIILVVISVIATIAASSLMK